MRLTPEQYAALQEKGSAAKINTAGNRNRRRLQAKPAEASVEYKAGSTPARPSNLQDSSSKRGKSTLPRKESGTPCTGAAMQVRLLPSLDVEQPKTPAKKSKYKNRKVVVDGITFDSKRESTRWLYLIHLEKIGQIEALRRQVRFPIVVNDTKICTWIADFTYRISVSGDDVVEDVKSEFTRKLPLYRLKYKLVHAVLGITIQEIV